jgi:hypothetical protein
VADVLSGVLNIGLLLLLLQATGEDVRYRDFMSGYHLPVKHITKKVMGSVPTPTSIYVLIHKHFVGQSN